MEVEASSCPCQWATGKSSGKVGKREESQRIEVSGAASRSRAWISSWPRLFWIYNLGACMLRTWYKALGCPPSGASHYQCSDLTTSPTQTFDWKDISLEFR